MTQAEIKSKWVKYHYMNFYEISLIEELDKEGSEF